MVPPTAAHKTTQQKKAKKSTTNHPPMNGRQARRSSIASPPGFPAETIATRQQATSAPAVPAAAVIKNPMEEKTVTVKEAAFRLRKSPDAVYGWLRSGRLRGWQPGGPCCPILVEESSLDEALSFTFCRAGAGRGRRVGRALLL
jgi:excisionase family DNA binding protein